MSVVTPKTIHPRPWWAGVLLTVTIGGGTPAADAQTAPEAGAQEVESSLSRTPPGVVFPGPGPHPTGCLRVRAVRPAAVVLDNAHVEPTGPVFVLNAGPGQGAFAEYPSGVPRRGRLEAEIPSLDGAPSLAAYGEALGSRMVTVLRDLGIAADEAEVTVNLWQHRWFCTPGIRVVYVAPRSWLERSPAASARAVLVRVEVVTPAMEATDRAAVVRFASSETVGQARSHFLGLGRFAEPRLRRALAAVDEPSPEAVHLLDDLARRSALQARSATAHPEWRAGGLTLLDQE